jgi:LytS/YehU family sensor histidine kinase
MMLQTLVENGIKHGISREVKGGTVSIKSEYRRDFYILTITNTGQLRAPQNEGGFGLTSTINRLQLLYSGKASFHIHQKAEDTVEARVTLPCS